MLILYTRLMFMLLIISSIFSADKEKFSPSKSTGAKIGVMVISLIIVMPFIMLMRKLLTLSFVAPEHKRGQKKKLDEVTKAKIRMAQRK